MTEPTTTDIAKANQHGSAVEAWAAGMMPALMKQIPADIGEAVRSSLAETAITQMRVNPDLARCTPASVMGALLRANTLGLRVGTGEFWLIPRKNGEASKKAGRDVYEATPQIGYQGYLTLIRRHSKAIRVVNEPVYEGDDFAIVRHEPVPFRHTPCLNSKERGELRGFYCTGIINGEWTDPAWMDKHEMQAHVDRYVKASWGPWSDELDRVQMARKTVLIRWAKRQQMPDELRTAVFEDDKAWFGMIDATELRADGQHAIVNRGGGSLSSRILNSQSVDAPPFDEEQSEEGAA